MARYLARWFTRGIILAIVFSIFPLSAFAELDPTTTSKLQQQAALGCPDPAQFITTNQNRADHVDSFQGVAVNGNSIQLSWTPADLFGAGAYYELFWGTLRGGPYDGYVKVTEMTASSYLITNLQPNTLYYILIRVYDQSYEVAFGRHLDEIEVNTSSTTPDISTGVEPFIDLTAPQVPIVYCFVLVDPATGQSLTAVNDSSIVDLATLPPNIEMHALVVPDVAASVVFQSSAGESSTDNDTPFAANLPSLLQADPNAKTLTATPYTGADGTGDLGEAKSITFTIVDSGTEVTLPIIENLVLVNADTGQDIQTLAEGVTLNLALLPPNLSIRAVTSPEVVGSVVFSYNNDPNVHVENSPPYSLLGDTTNADNTVTYTRWDVQVGAVVLGVTPYTAADAAGEAGSVYTLNLNVVNEVTLAGSLPSLEINSGLSVVRGTQATITNAQLLTTAGSSATTDILYGIITQPVHGALLLNGSPTGSFTQADIDGGALTYAHDGSEDTADNFTFGISVTQSPVAMTDQVFSITITDAETPVVEGDGGLLPEGVTGLNFVLASNAVQLNTPVTLQVFGQALTDLYGLSLDCQADATILTGSLFALDALFDPVDNLVLDQGFQADGTWTVVGLQKNPAQPINGDGLLMTLTYQGVALGTSTIVCQATASTRTGVDLPLQLSSMPQVTVATEVVQLGSGSTTGPATTSAGGGTSGTSSGGTTNGTTTNGTSGETSGGGTAGETSGGEPPELPTEEPQGSRIIGSVISITPQEVVLTLTDASGGVQTFSPDANGAFVVQNPAIGSYTLIATLVGHLPARVQIEIISENQEVLLPPVVLKNGDSNNDNTIDINDIPLVFALFLQSDNLGQADLNHDGIVDVKDLAIIAGNIGAADFQPWN